MAYLLGFSLLIVAVAQWWLLPATEAWAEADEAGRRQLSAYSTLLMVLTLVIALAGLALAFRVGRFFARTGDAPPTTPPRRDPPGTIEVK